MLGRIVIGYGRDCCIQRRYCGLVQRATPRYCAHGVASLFGDHFMILIAQ
jgi:hypothetical protein